MPKEVAGRVADLIGGAPQHTVECSGAQFSVNLGVHVSVRCRTNPSHVGWLVGGTDRDFCSMTTDPAMSCSL